MPLDDLSFASASLRDLGRMLRTGETTPTGLAGYYLDPPGYRWTSLQCGRDVDARTCHA